MYRIYSVIKLELDQTIVSSGLRLSPGDTAPAAVLEGTRNLCKCNYQITYPQGNFLPDTH